MSAIYILWLREVQRFMKSRLQVVAVISQPVLYLAVMGYGMDDVFRRAGLGSYLQFITPGVLVMAVLFPAAFSGMGLLMDRQFGFLKETLVAPVPRMLIVAGRTLGVATVALMQAALVGVVCVVFGFRPTNLALLPAAFAFLALIGLVFAGVGLIIGSMLKTPQGFNPVLNLLVVPLFFLSGAFFPLNHLPGALSVLTELNPLTYGMDGLRAALLEQSHFSASTDAIVLTILAVVVLCVGAWRFSRIEA